MEKAYVIRLEVGSRAIATNIYETWESKTIKVFLWEEKAYRYCESLNASSHKHYYVIEVDLDNEVPS